GVRLALACLPKFGVEPVPADVGRARQHLVHGADAPAPAVARPDAGCVEILGDRLHAHWTRAAIAFARQAEDQPDGLGLDRIDLQGLLDAVAALLGCLDDAVADRRQRAVPEALACVLLHDPQGVLGVLARDWYSSNSAMIWRIMLLIGSSPSSWVIDTSRTPFLASRRT